MITKLKLPLGPIAAIALWIVIAYYGVWNTLDSSGKFWVTIALILLFLSDTVIERTHKGVEVKIE
jgi:hypothetical protein